MKLRKLTLGQKYVFKKDFYAKAPSLSWHAKKGEMVTYEGRSRGHVQMRGSDWGLIIMNREEALDFLEKVIDIEGTKEFIRQRYATADVWVGGVRVVRDGVWLGPEGEALLEEKAQKHIEWMGKHPKRTEKEGALV